MPKKQKVSVELADSVAIMIGAGCLPKDIKIETEPTGIDNKDGLPEYKAVSDPTLIPSMHERADQISDLLNHKKRELVDFAFARSSSDLTVEIYSLLVNVWKYEGRITDRTDILQVIDSRTAKSTGISSMELLVDWDPDTTDKIKTAIIKGERIVVAGQPGSGRRSAIGIGLLKALKSGFAADVYVTHIPHTGASQPPTPEDAHRRHFIYIPNLPTVSKFMHQNPTLTDNLRRRTIIVTEDASDIGGLHDSEYTTTVVDIEEPDSAAMFKIIRQRLKSMGSELEDDDLDSITQITEKVHSTTANPGKSLDVLRRVIINNKEINVENVSEEVRTMSNFVSDFVGNSATGINKVDRILKREVIGQQEAVTHIVKELKKRVLRVGNNKPCTFMFAGQTGLGKTLLAKTLAKVLYGTEDALIRVNMNQFSESHAVSAWSGAPAGYVGYNDKSILDRIADRGGEVVLLLDELEKAHQSMDDELLQIIDEGETYTKKQRRVRVGNSIIIATTNLGTKSSVKGKISYESSSNSSEDLVMREIKQTLKAEMINRFDAIVVFNKFKKDDIIKIITLEIQKLFDNMKVDNKAKDLLSKIAFKEGNVDVYGAREIGRIVRNHVEDIVIDYMISNNIESKDHLHNVTLSEKNGKIVVTGGK